MTEPRPLPPLPRPFEPAPRTLRTGPGCGRGVWIGCGALLVVFLVAVVALSFRADDMMVWIFGRLEEKVTANLPADLQPTERDRLDDAFEDLNLAVQRGEVDPAAIQRLQRILLDLSGDVDRGLSREQVLELTEALERAAGEPPGAGDEPGESPPSPR